ncbi:MAG TPA: TetR/AcrR family transcriptional regulator [Pirellulales bacterium]
MTADKRRKKQPVVTRQQLLDRAAELMLTSGIAGVTLDAVAHAAGVSKGGLLHHFSSKQQLIDAVITAQYEFFKSVIADEIARDPNPVGRRTRAYIRAAASLRNHISSKLCAIISVEARDSEVVRRQWQECRAMLFNPEHPQGEDAVLLAVVQLAADGLWLADLDGAFDAAPENYFRVIERLERLTLDAAVPIPPRR